MQIIIRQLVGKLVDGSGAWIKTRHIQEPNISFYGHSLFVNFKFIIKFFLVFFFSMCGKKKKIKIQSIWPIPGWLKKKKKKDSDLVGILLKISSRQHRKRGKWCVCSEKEVGALDGAWLYVVLGAGQNLKSFKDTKELSTEGRLIHSQQTFTVWRQQAQPLKCLKLQDSLWAHDAAKTKLGLNPPGKKSHWQSLLTLLSHTHSNITQN